MPSNRTAADDHRGSLRAERTGDFLAEPVLCAPFPGVTVFDLEVIILGQVRMIIDRASLSVQYVFLFTLLAGIIVLLAAIQATRDERRFESALLHTLGARRNMILKAALPSNSRRWVVSPADWPHSAPSSIGWIMADQVFQLDYTLNPVGAGSIGFAVRQR